MDAPGDGDESVPGNDGESVPNIMLDLLCDNCVEFDSDPSTHTQFGMCGECRAHAFVHVCGVSARPKEYLYFLPVIRLSPNEVSVVEGAPCYNPDRQQSDSTDIPEMVRQFVRSHGCLIDPLTAETYSMAHSPDDLITHFCPVAAELPCCLDIDGCTEIVTLGV